MMRGPDYKPTLKMRAVMVPDVARRSDRPPPAQRADSTQKLEAVSQEMADEFDRTLQAERTLREVRQWGDEVDEGWS